MTETERAEVRAISERGRLGRARPGDTERAMALRAIDPVGYREAHALGRAAADATVNPFTRR